MSQSVTIPGLLSELASAGPDMPLILEKRYGKWTPRTRADIVQAVGELASGVRALGVGPGDTALVMLASHASWIIVDLGLQAAGIRVAAVATDADSGTLSSVLTDSAARIAFVQDQDSADRVLEIIEERGAGTLEHLVYVDPAGVAEYTNELLRAYGDIRERGRAVQDAGLTSFLAERDSDEVAVLSYSYGVTGRPGAALLTHRALVAGARVTASALELGPADRVMAVRPLSDPVERGATLYPALISGSLLVLPENAATVGQAAWETAPTSVHLTLRHLKTVAAQVRVRMQSTRGVKGLFAKLWYRRFRAALAADRVEPPTGIWKALVGYPVLEKLGLNRARQVVVSGDRVPREAVLFFRALGLRLTPAYALSQTGGLIALDADADGRTVGAPLNGVEIRIGDDGEILVRGDSVAHAPHGGPPPHIDEDGWLHTNDIGTLDASGRLLVSHRRGETISIPGGEQVSATLLESELRASPYIKDVVADGVEGGVRLIIELMQPTVERWASRNGVEFTTFHALSQKPEVSDLVDRAVAHVTAKHDGLVVTDLVIVDQALERVPGALTPSGKVRRSSMVELGDAIGRARDAKPLPQGNAPAR
jgi:long-chain acyl-CoA synthetase